MANIYRRSGTYTVKICKDCGIEKPTKEFQKHGSFFSSYCKLCKNQRTKVDNYKRRYDLTASEVENLHQRFPVCFICESVDDLVIDHNHKTGDVRGILCHGCNTGLGFFKENSESLLKAVEYLKLFTKEKLTHAVS